MTINKQSEITGDLQIGPTDYGMVRIYVTGDGFELPFDFRAGRGRGDRRRTDGRGRGRARDGREARSLKESGKPPRQRGRGGIRPPLKPQRRGARKAKH